MPSKLVLPSESVFISIPPLPCLPFVLTACMTTMALRTGLPLSSFRMRKFSTAVGPSSSPRCGVATAASARIESKQTSVRVLTFVFILNLSNILPAFIPRHSSECEECGEVRSIQDCAPKSGLSSRAVFALSAAGLSCELHNVTGHTGRVVAGDAGLFQIVPENRDHAQSFYGIEVGHNLAGAFHRVLCFHFHRNRRAVDQSIVEELTAGMVIQSPDVIGRGEGEALIGLGHQVADIKLGRGRVDNGIGNAMHEQVRNEAGEQGTRTDADDIGTGNGVERLR